MPRSYDSIRDIAQVQLTRDHEHAAEEAACAGTLRRNGASGLMDASMQGECTSYHCTRHHQIPLGYFARVSLGALCTHT